MYFQSSVRGSGRLNMALCIGLIMLDSEQSLRLNLLRFPLIVGVVFIHAYGSTAVFAGNEIGINQTDFVTDFIRNFISNGIARIAVPLFFLISGYLFFAGFEWSKERYFVKLRARIKTLLIPFIFWNIVTLSIIAVAQAIPATQIYFSGKSPLIAGFSSFDYLNAIVGINRSPIAYQFWFIRDLMILVLLVPFIKIILKVFPLQFLVIVFICWFSGAWSFYAPSSDAVLFFCVGAYLASMDKNLFAVDKYGSILVLLYLIIVTFDALFIKEPFNPYLHKFGIIFGILAALFMTKFLARTENIKSFILWLSSASFFVYAIHEPLLTILKKISYKLVSPDTSSLILFLYFFIPIVVIAFSIIAYRVLLGVAPKFASIVTGGR